MTPLSFFNTYVQSIKLPIDWDFLKPTTNAYKNLQ